MEMTQVSQCQVIQDRSLSLPYSELVEMFFLSQTTGAFFPTAFFCSYLDFTVILCRMVLNWTLTKHFYG